MLEVGGHVRNPDHDLVADVVRADLRTTLTIDVLRDDHGAISDVQLGAMVRDLKPFPDGTLQLDAVLIDWPWSDNRSPLADSSGVISRSERPQGKRFDPRLAHRLLRFRALWSVVPGRDFWIRQLRKARKAEDAGGASGVEFVA